ncbi:MAG: MbcA/ParS/Xre antitoxin family protein [Gammaproteobacteria bacterium]|nr:MbcA/ParS/Xre antitoxin family protein [Gammaproteobacteria bacterium]
MHHARRDIQVRLSKEPVLTELERASQTKMIIRLFELWALTPTQQSLCLGLSIKTRTNIHKYQTGAAFLPLYRDIQDRIKLLLSIHKQLRRLFPRNEEIIYGWINFPNRYFENFSPLDVICRDGLAGLIAVKEYLDRALAI